MKAKVHAYTSVTSNYIPKARVLAPIGDRFCAGWSGDHRTAAQADLRRASSTEPGGGAIDHRKPVDRGARLQEPEPPTRGGLAFDRFGRNADVGDHGRRWPDGDCR